MHAVLLPGSTQEERRTQAWEMQGMGHHEFLLFLEASQLTGGINVLRKLNLFLKFYFLSLLAKKLS